MQVLFRKFSRDLEAREPRHPKQHSTALSYPVDFRGCAKTMSACISIKREERVNPKALTIPLLLMVSLRKIPLAYQRLVQEGLWETVCQLDSI